MERRKRFAICDRNNSFYFVEDKLSVSKLDFLDTLPLSESEKIKLRSLRLKGPDELYDLIGATLKTDRSFEDFFGKERTFHLLRFLYPLISEKTKKNDRV